MIPAELYEAEDELAPEPDSPDPRAPKQDRAVAEGISGLDNLRGTNHPDWRAQDARGKVIMPCGTGKTRVGYRIARQLCAREANATLTVVLCPSIGLVRQLWRQWRGLADEYGDTLQTLSVCSDETVADMSGQRRLWKRSGAPSASDEAVTEDPTVDLSGRSITDLFGSVAKDAAGVSAWLAEHPDHRRVIFSTYQSSRHTAQGIHDASAEADVLICDEAHRTAGLKKKNRKKDEAFSNFTVCHRNDELPAKNRVYMTATPRSYARGKALRANEQWEQITMDNEALYGPELHRLSYAEAVLDGILTDYRIIAVAPTAETRAMAEDVARRVRERADADIGARRGSTSLALPQARLRSRRVRRRDRRGTGRPNPVPAHHRLPQSSGPFERHREGPLPRDRPGVDRERSTASRLDARPLPADAPGRG